VVGTGIMWEWILDSSRTHSLTAVLCMQSGGYNTSSAKRWDSSDILYKIFGGTFVEIVPCIGLILV